MQQKNLQISNLSKKDWLTYINYLAYIINVVPNLLEWSSALQSSPSELMASSAGSWTSPTTLATFEGAASLESPIASEASYAPAKRCSAGGVVAVERAAGQQQWREQSNKSNLNLVSPHLIQKYLNENYHDKMENNNCSINEIYQANNK
jgi:hypothetical protein